MSAPAVRRRPTVRLLLAALSFSACPGAGGAAEPIGPVALFERFDPGSDLDTRNWIREVTATSSLRPSPRSPGALLVLAGDLELPDPGRRLAGKRPARNLVLIGDEIRLSGRLDLDLSGSGCDRAGTPRWRQRAAGGHLVILARRLVCEAGGRLHFVSGGGESCTVRIHDKRKGSGGRERIETRKGGDGGVLFLAAEQFALGDREVAPEEFVEHGCVAAATPGGGGAKPGRPGGIRAVTGLSPATSELGSLGRHAVSKWVLAVLSRAAVEIRSADLARGRVEAARRLAEGLRLSDQSRFPVLPEDEVRYRERLEELAELRDALSGSLWREALTLPAAGGVPRRAELFTAGRDLETRAAPTDALLVRRTAGGRRVLGLMEFDPEEPDELRLELQAELRLDPWVGSQIARELAGRGEELAGVFDDWSLRGREIDSPGIVDSRVEVGPDGRTVRVALTLETDRASLVLAQLSSSAGLPLVFDWEYRHDRNLRGTWEGPPLTLLRRADSGLVLDRTAGRVTNTGDVELTLEYLRAGDRFLPLARPLAVPPGETADLPLPEDVAASGVSIPATAVLATGTDPFRVQGAFQVVNGEELMEQVTVTNHLSHDERFGGGLEYVEIEIVYTVAGGGGKQKIAVGPYRLAPSGAEGSEIAISLIKPRHGERSIRVSGTAYYAGGSRQTLTPRSFSDLWIHLTDEMLPSTTAADLRDGKELP